MCRWIVSKQTLALFMKGVLGNIFFCISLQYFSWIKLVQSKEERILSKFTILSRLGYGSYYDVLTYQSSLDQNSGVTPSRTISETCLLKG